MIIVALKAIAVAAVSVFVFVTIVAVLAYYVDWLVKKLVK